MVPMANLMSILVRLGAVDRRRLVLRLKLVDGLKPWLTVLGFKDSIPTICRPRFRCL
jgi:hypothetical protein